VREARSAHHYMILPAAVVDFKKAALKSGIAVIEVPCTDTVYSDPQGYLYVTNYMGSDLNDTIDWDSVRMKASDPKAAVVDTARNNRRSDIGYCGHRNSERHVDNLGLSKPRVLNGTTEESSKRLFLAMTQHVGKLRELFGLDIYSDEDRNSLLSGMICIGNIIEAIACSILEPDSRGHFLNLLKCHRDLYNCLTAEYSWLVTVTKLVYNEDAGAYTRLGCHAYGKQSGCDFLAKTQKYSAVIRDVTAMVQALPFQLKTVTHQNISLTETTSLSGTHLNKMCRYYHTIGSAIESFLVATRRCSNGIRITGGLLVSACSLSHKPLMFYEWMGVFAVEVAAAPCSGSALDAEGDALTYKIYELILERISAMKRDRDNGTFTITVSRLQPTVGTRMHFQQFTRSIDTFERMVWEVSARQEIDPQYLVRNTEYVVDALVAVLCLPNILHANKSSTVDNGLYGFRGAGHLMAQMIIGVTVRLGLFPPVLATFSRIPPRNWLHWCKKYSTLSVEGHVEESEEILKATDIMCKFNGNKSMSEEAFCKLKGSEGRFVDVNPQGLENAWFEDEGQTLWVGIEPGNANAVQVQSVMTLPTAKQLGAKLLGNAFFDHKYSRKITKKKKPAPAKVRLDILDHFPINRNLVKNSAREGAIRPSLEAIARQLDVLRKEDIVHALDGVSLHRLDPEMIVRESLGFPSHVKQKHFVRFREATGQGDSWTSHSCAIIVHSHCPNMPTLINPSPNFELYDYSLDNSTWVCPNSGLRFFKSREAALQYTMLYFIFVFKGVCGVDFSARLLYMLPDKAEHNPTKTIRSFAVFYKGCNAKKGMVPFLVAIRHSLDAKPTAQGGLSYYLLNSNLVRTSGTLLSRPPGQTGSDRLSTWHGQQRMVLGVHSHHGPIAAQDQDYFGSSYNLRLCFEDGSIEMLPVHVVKKHVPELVIEYALMHDLSDTPPFRGFCRRTQLRLGHNITILTRVLEKPVQHTTQTSASKNRKKRHKRKLPMMQSNQLTWSARSKVGCQSLSVNRSRVGGAPLFPSNPQADVILAQQVLNNKTLTPLDIVGAGGGGFRIQSDTDCEIIFPGPSFDAAFGEPGESVHQASDRESSAMRKGSSAPKIESAVCHGPLQQVEYSAAMVKTSDSVPADSEIQHNHNTFVSSTGPGLLLQHNAKRRRNTAASKKCYTALQLPSNGSPVEANLLDKHMLGKKSHLDVSNNDGTMHAVASSKLFDDTGNPGLLLNHRTTSRRGRVLKQDTSNPGLLSKKKVARKKK
jgi:hypothetical protein